MYVRRGNIALSRSLYNHGKLVTDGNPKPGLCPTLIKWLQGFFIVHSTIDSITHSHVFEQRGALYIPMTNIRPGRDSNPVPWVSSHNRTEWAKRVGHVNVQQYPSFFNLLAFLRFPSIPICYGYFTLSARGWTLDVRIWRLKSITTLDFWHLQTSDYFDV